MTADHPVVEEEPVARRAGAEVVHCAPLGRDAQAVRMQLDTFPVRVEDGMVVVDVS